MNVRRVIQGASDVSRLVALHARRSLRSESNGPSGGPRSSGIVVSLTTIPSRIAGILPAVNSLLDQTVLPERIVLTVPDRSRREQMGYVVPDALRAHPRVSIVSCEHDWGPATKLIPTLLGMADQPDVPILAVDDDNVYPRTFVETFQRFAAEMPDAALSMRGFRVPPSRRWRDRREFPGTSIDTPVRVDIVQGCGGILVRPRFFDPEVFEYANAPPEAFFVDDIWFSGNLARRRVARYVIPFSGALIYLPSLATFSGTGLDRDVNRSGRNDDVMIDHFGSDWAQT